MRTALPRAVRSRTVQETLRTQLRFHYPSVSDVVFTEDAAQIEASEPLPAREVSALVERLDAALRRVPPVPARVVYDSRAAEAPAHRAGRRHDRNAFDHAVRALVADLSEAADGAAAAVPTRPAGRGLNRYGTGATALHRILDSFLRRYFVRAYGAADLRVPSLLPLPVADRAGYLETASQHLSFVCPLDPDPGRYDRFLPFWREHARDGSVPGAVHEFLTPPRDVLNPALCLHSFEPLADSDLGDEPAVVTMSGSCFRDESGNLNNVERLREFGMREAVFVGTAARLDQIHGQLVDFMAELADFLGLDARVESATDVFFTDGAAERLLSQLLSDNKLELAVRGAGGERPTATASVNKHQTHFTSRFGITAAGDPAMSMCLGVGLDRLALAVARQAARQAQPSPLAGLLARASAHAGGGPR